MHFEDMIHDPGSFANAVCGHIGLSVYECEDKLRTWATRVQDTNNKQFVEAQTSRHHSRPDHSVRVGRWRENLSDEQARSAARIVSSANRRFHYDLHGFDRDETNNTQ